MRAHQLNDDGLIINTIEVNSFDVFPNLIDASIGGSIGDSIVNGVVAAKQTAVIEVTQAPDINQQIMYIEELLITLKAQINNG